jgi:D-alanyl-lipoteichoic acid acyltransferase DltB (MBOAT superfamily)
MRNLFICSFFLFFGAMQAISGKTLFEGRSMGAVHFSSKYPMPPLKGDGKALDYYETFFNVFLYYIIQSKFQNLQTTTNNNVTMLITLCLYNKNRQVKIFLLGV